MFEMKTLQLMLFRVAVNVLLRKEEFYVNAFTHHSRLKIQLKTDAESFK